MNDITLHLIPRRNYHKRYGESKVTDSDLYLTTDEEDLFKTKQEEIEFERSMDREIKARLREVNSLARWQPLAHQSRTWASISIKDYDFFSPYALGTA